MPIKPENRSRYPKNWTEVRASILERAGNCCEQCKVPNGERIARGAGEDAGTFMKDDGSVYEAETGEHLGQCRMSDYEVGRMTNVVLTVAHLDHTPENCDPANLKALCQRCHLAYDAKHHAETARATRRTRLNNGELFA
jgi:hypothetical protein